MLHTKELAGLLRQVKTIAVIGAKDRAGQPVDRVGRYLIGQGFSVIPVHPKRKGVWGLTTYRSIRDIPGPIDLVNVFRAPQFCPDHARECLALTRLPRCFWMQSGITSPEVHTILSQTGMAVIEDACLMVEHRRLFGGTA